jgi:hypothetical protein
MRPRKIVVGFEVAKLAALYGGGFEVDTVEAITDAMGVLGQCVDRP